MRAIILAAGMGNRLGEYTANNTKCMVEVNGKRLIEYTLNSLKSVGIKEVVIVIGYKGENVVEFVGSEYNGMKITYIENNIYDKTNNIYSLWLAREFFSEDVLLLESDLIFEENILQRLINDKRKNLVVVDKYQSWMDGTVTTVNDEEKICSFIDKKEFNWQNKSEYYKTVNIYKFSSEFLNKDYLPFLEAHIKSQGSNCYYEAVLKVITSLGSVELEALKVKNEIWYEIDDIQDLDIASTLFGNENEKLGKFQKRYGGYWRFPNIKDFCYLVNPYFPSDRMIRELTSNFETLIREYPSGLNIQNLLASKLFKCKLESILVGNGAAELINVLINNIEGNIGVIYPTFNEYGARIGESRIKKFIVRNCDFKYSIDELKEFSKGLQALVLINPDNPSGHCFSKYEILDLLQYLKEKNIKLILDESFIDFAGESERFTMMDKDILANYKNLIVIKSISKSYGVPGCRLGVMVSSNEEILQKVRRGLPIWNINSFGEYFLQIIGKYEKDYIVGCNNIAEERERFFNRLNEIKYIRVIPSKSNYFLCELSTEFTSTEFTKLLLCKYNILIKDCCGKQGNNERNIRIAVRDKEDNDYLINVLKEIEKLYISKEIITNQEVAAASGDGD